MKILINKLIFVSCLLCFILVSGRLSANPIDPNTAKMAAKRFFESKSMFRSANNEEPAIVRTDKKTDTENYFYVLESPDKRGWLIIAGNDDVTPVIAYSDEGSFSQSNGRNENFEYWMDCMKEEIDYIVGKEKSVLKSSVQSKTKTEWDNLLKPGSTQLRASNVAQAADIPRLLGNIIWNQGNNFAAQGELPTYNKFTPNNWPVGCVATAIGQIMKAQLGTRSITGTGSHSDATPGYGQLSADFGNTTYNFANMPDRIWGITLTNMYVPTDEYGRLFPTKSSDTEIDAVAQLLYHIGIACDMNYGPSSSSAGILSPLVALPAYFKYETPQYVARINVTESAWDNYVLTELQAGRPVYYSGQQSSGGHAFVVDGYSDADHKYHFNWGWGGYKNGYFALSLIEDDPEISYRDNQSIIIGLVPKEDDEPVAVSVTGVSLNQTTATLTVGEALQLTATIAPADATNKNVNWFSSSPTVASVDATGKVSALAKGTATIAVTTEDGNKIATCAVTVNPATPSVIAVTGVSLNQNTVTLIAGNTLQLTATVAPADATNKNVTWSSSSPTVASVDATGKITALAAGTTTIAVTTEDGNKTATCTVIVNPATVSVTGVSLNQTTATLITGNTLQLTATVAPTDATNKNVTWSSSAPAVASVDATGKVSALAAGTATITVTTEDGNKTATCTIIVNPATPSTIAVTGVSLNQTTATLIVGNTLQLTATVAPADATNKKVSWSSSATTIATVDANGKVIALVAGTTTITVTTEDGNKTATCVVTVNPEEPSTIAVTSVSLNQTTATLVVGNTLQLTATVVPTDATNKIVSWSSDDESVATVSNIGLITAIGKGTANIIVTTEDGNFTATCKVTVTSKTAISELTAETYAYLYKNRLYIKSPVAETIQVYSVNGVLLYNFQKLAGSADYIVSRTPGSVLVVKGDSGWVKKVIR